MTDFFLGTIVGLCAWLLFFAVWWLHPRFWPPARRQERYRIRLDKTKDELRRDRVAEEASLASRLSVPERRALHSLTLEEMEEAFHIPRTGPSLDGSWPGMTPPGEIPHSGSISSESSTVRAHGTRAP